MSLTTPLFLLLGVPPALLIVGMWRRSAVSRGVARATLVLGPRLATMAAIVLALAGLSVRLPVSRQAAVFVADLSASDAERQSTVQALIDAATSERPSGDVAGVVTAGRDAQVDQPVSTLNVFPRFSSTVDRRYTNLQSGLELAGALLPPGYRRRIVLLSDGQQNLGDAPAAARLLHSQGVRVDVVPLHVPVRPEVRVDRVDTPSLVRPLEDFTVSVRLWSNVRTASEIRLYRDGRLIVHRRIAVYPGSHSVAFNQTSLRPHFYSYDARISPERDTSANNNVGSAFTLVSRPAGVLVVAADPSSAVNVVHSLRAGGIRADLRTPAQLRPTAAFLRHYASVVLVDTPADLLGAAFMRQLVPYVRDLGHGLVVIGGVQSYSEGGYAHTPLEQLLPVKMNIPQRKDVPTVAVVLIIEDLETDRSVSISKEAGKAIIALLTPRDLVAVNDTPDFTGAGWVVKLRHPSDKRVIDRAIDRMIPGDPDEYIPYFKPAFAMLKHAPARVKHIIFLGDGDAGDVNKLGPIRTIRQGGVTLSTVATDDINGFQEPGALRKMAIAGGGRFYRARDASRVPRIFLREARALDRSGIVQGRVVPRELSSSTLLQGLPAVPSLSGYVATMAKPTGDVVLAAGNRDPILASWQFGLGRTVAWTSDAAGRWTHAWLRSPAAARFWVNLVGWTAPLRSPGHLFLSASEERGQGMIAVDTPPSLEGTARVVAHVVGPDRTVTRVQLQPSNLSRFLGSFPTRRPGAYRVSVAARSPRGSDSGETGLAVSYSPEYRTIGTSSLLLHRIAVEGGGGIINRPADVWSNNLETVYASHSLADLLWILAVLLLPVDIALRRLAGS